MIVFVAPLTALVGLIAYALGKDKVAELGRLAFVVGLLSTLFLLNGTHAVHLP